MLVIIGLMTSAVVMTLPKAPPASRAVSETLLKRLNQTAQESLLSGRPAAFGLSKSSLTLYTYDGEDWTAVQSKSWPDVLTVSLRQDGEDVKLAEKPVPLILFEPTGNSSVFTLTLSDFDGRYTLSSNGDGRVVLGRGS